MGTEADLTALKDHLTGALNNVELMLARRRLNSDHLNLLSTHLSEARKLLGALALREARVRQQRGRPRTSHEAWETLDEYMKRLNEAMEERLRRQYFGGFSYPRGEARSTKTCWSVLGLKPDATAAEIKAAYREKAKTCHPDAGGSEDAMVELNRARDAALASARRA